MGCKDAIAVATRAGSPEIERLRGPADRIPGVRYDRAGRPSTGKRRFSEIDGLRAVAVLAVVVCHCIGFGPLALQIAIGQSGARGVDLFFVISGFCLAFPLLRALREDGTPLVQVVPFVRRRFARVAPSYYVALLAFGAFAFTKVGLPTWPGAVPPVAEQLQAIGRDLLFLTNEKPIHNCDFWTLGVEMRWYVIFPLVLALYVRTRIGFAALMLAFYAAYASPYGIPDLGMYPCFMFGIVAADLVLRGYRWLAYVAPAAAVATLAALWMQSQTPVLDHGNALWHVAAFLTVIAVTGNYRLRRCFSHPALVATGVASYSIYLVHHPILAELVLRGVPIWLAAVVSVAAGFGFWYGVERTLSAAPVRKRLEAALTFRRLPARAPETAPASA